MIQLGLPFGVPGGQFELVGAPVDQAEPGGNVGEAEHAQVGHAVAGDRVGAQVEQVVGALAAHTAGRGGVGTLHSGKFAHHSSRER